MTLPIQRQVRNIFDHLAALVLYAIQTNKVHALFIHPAKVAVCVYT